MITEDYVSFAIAKLLKEKGFSEPCCTFYEYKKKLYKDMDKYFPNGMTNTDHDKEGNGGIAAPTFQKTMKWLRAKHNLFIVVDCGVGAYVWTITNTTDCVVVYVGATVGTYEEACEAAIKYALENLI